MAYEEQLRTVSYEAGQDLSNAQYLFVVQAADKQVDPVAVLGARASGILQNNPGAVGRAASVAIAGSISKLRVGGVVAVQANVTAAADGRGVTAETGHHINAIALEASAAANDVITVQMLEGTEVA